jgi:hypothetical protein
MGSPSIPYASNERSELLAGEKSPQPVQTKKEKPEVIYYSKLMGSSTHNLSEPQNVYVFIFPDKIVLDPLGDAIRYSSIVSIENIDERQAVNWEKVIGLGIIFAPLAIIGYLRKERRAISVIKYITDKPQPQTIVIDFKANVRYAYDVISRRMNQSRRIINADKSAILLTIEAGNNPISLNGIQNLKIIALDPKSDAVIPNAMVRGHLIAPQISEFKQDVTNSGGGYLLH